MVQRPARLLATILGLMLVGCLGQSFEAKLQVFGTLLTIRLEGVEQDQAEVVITSISQDFQQLHRDWHAWQPGSLDRINDALARGQSHSIDPELANLLRTAGELESLSGGFFNAAMGNLIRAWGFHTSDYPVQQAPPKAEHIERLLAQRPSLSDITLHNRQIHSRNRAVRIDLGGIAKGAALARARAMIASLNPDRALIDAGGDLLAWSKSEPWRIAIRDPSDPNSAIAVIEIDDPMAVFSSGNYTRNRAEPRRRGHIIDPHSGHPIEHTLSATVIATDPVVADAAATALVVAGPKRWRSIAASMGIDLALVVLADGCIGITEKLAKDIDWTTPPTCLTSD